MDRHNVLKYKIYFSRALTVLIKSYREHKPDKTSFDWFFFFCVEQNCKHEKKTEMKINVES